MVDIILTADRTLLNNFHLKKNFSTGLYGSADLFPPWLYALSAGKPRKSANGQVLFAPYPLRKIEAKIIDGGYEVATYSPSNISKHIKDAKILGIHTVDPLGFATSPFLKQIFHEKEPYSVKYFRKLLQMKAIKRAKKQGLKIIVGGPGAWQIQSKPKIQTQLGIDCVIIGEAENIIINIIKKGLQNEKLPRHIRCKIKEIPDIIDIPCIKKASNSGCVEIGRGCVRGCKFCDVSRNRFRWLPLENIENELKVNVKSGVNEGILHAEDVLLYGQSGVIPDVKKLIQLIKLIKKYYKRFLFTHFSLAAVSAKPRTIPKLMELILEDQNSIVGEAGIETGSVRLLSETMSGKIKPFKKEQWHEIISNSLGILHDNSFIPYLSFISGLPGESEDDIIQTLELIDDIKHFRCIILPGNFTPLGRYEKNKGFSLSLNGIDELNKEIVKKSIAHDLYWANDIRYKFYENSKYKTLLHLLTSFLMRQYKSKAKRIGYFN